MPRLVNVTMYVTRRTAPNRLHAKSPAHARPNSALSAGWGRKPSDLQGELVCVVLRGDRVTHGMESSQATLNAARRHCHPCSTPLGPALPPPSALETRSAGGACSDLVRMSVNESLVFASPRMSRRLPASQVPTRACGVRVLRAMRILIYIGCLEVCHQGQSAWCTASSDHWMHACARVAGSQVWGCGRVAVQQRTGELK